MEAGQLIEDNEIIRKHRHDNASDFQAQNPESDESPLKTRGEHNNNLPRLRDLMDMEDREDVRDNQLRGTTPQNIVPVVDINLFEKETKNYAQKKVTQCEVPEFIVYLKETPNHAVNIRFDDEVPSCDKTALENKEANHSSDLCFSSCTSDVHSDLIKVIMEDLASNSDAMGEHDTKNLMEDGEGKFNFTDGLGSVSCSEKFVTMDVLPVRKKEMDKLQFEALDDDEDMQQSDQDTYKEVNSSSSSLFCAAKATNYGNIQGTSPNACLESDSFTINPGSSDISGEQTHSELVHTLTIPAVEDSLGELISASSRSILTQHGQGESSFSALDNPAALVTRSGRIAYSGSISLRSDSSTTSTRSFAFPILQADWHTSPVRMAKADRRHYRKHQRWKLSLLCCKF
ncbi:hypothetical protein MKW98_017494 [Papaver atlanticum]|uniref:Uncharacterized protein n=1 Tax=Papaver atlanticum TaxID=357466 RepID=A0AAD4TEC9_9MAGN|nr:hypothetical protein MKW98_017494 [Papaver atlanticum]